MYETESFWSVEEIKKMNKAFLFKMNKWYVILVGIVEVGFLTIGIVSLLNPHLRFWGVFMLSHPAACTYHKIRPHGKESF